MTDPKSKNPEKDPKTPSPAATPTPPETPTPTASYPPPAKDIRSPDGKTVVETANPEEAERARKFRAMGHTKCCHSRCHYPLNKVKNSRNEPVRVDTEDGPATEAVCSWDPSHLRPGNRPQYVPDPVKGDDE